MPFVEEPPPPIAVPRTASIELPRAPRAEPAPVTEHINVPRRPSNRWLVLATITLALGIGAVVFFLLTKHDDPDRKVASATPPPPAAQPGTPPTAGVSVCRPSTDAAEIKPQPTDPTSDEGPPGPVNTPVVGAGPCKLTVHTTPAGSMVVINGDTAGPSPITVSGPCDERRVEISHPRYQSVTRAVTPSPEKPQVIDVTLVRPTHTVMVMTTPPGANVAIDGRSAGTSPTAIKVLGFTSVELTITKTGFQPHTMRLYSRIAQDRVAVKLVGW